jgi:hypothetical protein
MITQHCLWRNTSPHCPDTRVAHIPVSQYPACIFQHLRASLNAIPIGVILVCLNLALYFVLSRGSTVDQRLDSIEGQLIVHKGLFHHGYIVLRQQQKLDDYLEAMGTNIVGRLNLRGTRVQGSMPLSFIQTEEVAPLVLLK